MPPIFVISIIFFMLCQIDSAWIVLLCYLITMRDFLPPVHGHQDQIRALNQLMASDRVPVSIIFSGTQGLGKATLALYLAAYLVERESFASHSLETSRRLSQNAHPRVLVLKAQTPESDNIDADSVREARKFIHLSAQADQWRVLIVDAVDQLNRFGANALLKLAEEPRPRTLLILINHNRARILPTLRSRSYFLTFQDVILDEVADIPSRVRDYVAGNPAHLKQYQDPDESGFYEETLDLLESLVFQRHAAGMQSYIRNWFTGEKSDLMRRLQTLETLLLIFTHKHGHELDTLQRKQLWQANDSLRENLEKYRVFHLDLSSILCQNLGSLIYLR